MDPYTGKMLSDALEVISSTVATCEKIQPKFAEGTSQHTLLTNRIRAMHVSEMLITGEKAAEEFSKDALVRALPPVRSIIAKCVKARLKFSEGTTYYARFTKIINAMSISESLIQKELKKRKV